MNPAPVLIGRFNDRVTQQHMVGQIQGFSAAVRGGPVAYRQWRQQQEQQLVDLERQVNEFAARFGGRPARPARPAKSLSLREKLANARRSLTTPERSAPAAKMSVRDKFEAARQGIPISARPKSLVKASPESWQVSFHEAGHVVACLAVGAPIVSADIVASDDRLGRVLFQQTKLDALSMLVVAYAGHLAEIQFADKDARSGGQDESLARQILATLSPRDRDETETQARAQARRLVKANRGVITQVAATLRDHRTLSGDDLQHFAKKVKQW